MSTVIRCHYWNDIPLTIPNKSIRKLFKSALYQYYFYGKGKGPSEDDSMHPSVSFAPACAITVIWPSTFKMIVSPISVHLLHLGQNLAREWAGLGNPADRVRLWYQDSSNYSFSKFSTPVVCSKPPCRKYNQV